MIINFLITVITIFRNLTHPPTHSQRVKFSCRQSIGTSLTKFWVGQSGQVEDYESVGTVKKFQKFQKGEIFGGGRTVQNDSGNPTKSELTL